MGRVDASSHVKVEPSVKNPIFFFWFVRAKRKTRKEEEALFLGVRELFALLFWRLRTPTQNSVSSDGGV
jgi:hypothetical protein